MFFTTSSQDGNTTFFKVLGGRAFKMGKTKKSKMDIIINKLREVGAEYNRREVEMYVSHLLALSAEELQKKSGEDIANQIKNALDKVYTPRP